MPIKTDSKVTRLRSGARISRSIGIASRLDKSSQSPASKNQPDQAAQTKLFEERLGMMSSLHKGFMR
jgi:hypothetical protein